MAERQRGRFKATFTQTPLADARWCRVSQWAIPDWYSVCPYCKEIPEPTRHPRWPGLADELYAPVESGE